MRKFLLISLLSFVFVLPPIVHAQTISTTLTPTEKLSPTQKLSPTHGLKATVMMERQEIRQTFQEKRKEAIEEFKEKREAFKEKLEGMKDTRKQAILERVDERINNMNEKHLERLDAYIDNLKEILARVQTKTDAAKADGGDVEKVETAIDEAKATIDTAETAISEQAGKEYIIDFSTEARIGQEAKKVFSEFRQDITAVHSSVKKAHKEVIEAARAIGTLKTETPTPTETP